MDRLFELEVFLAVLDAGSLSAAARRLGRSGPAITRILSGLEDRLGARLFDRTTRSLAVTEEGRNLEEQARGLLAGYGALARTAKQRGELSGRVRVTAPVVFGRLHVAPSLARFMAAHEGVAVDLTLDDANRDLVGDGYDAAIRIGALPDSELVARQVGEVGRYLVASPAYLERAGCPMDPSELSGHALILTRSVPGPAEWRLEQEGRPRIVRFEPRFSVNHVETALALARDGVGIARALSYQVAEDLGAGRLVRLLAAFEPPLRAIHVVHLGRRHMAARTKALVRHLADDLGSRSYVSGPSPSGTSASPGTRAGWPSG
ncbi:LysR family transcriptional regulator [Alsobacter sp. KACC 23698]|uniref:LysR family transcriptional regulator n=1 Tax=Alsobacter sp. KACC 23698 TaxID=3149229 RepID=A0AAU7JDN7_9HYPH